MTKIATIRDSAAEKRMRQLVANEVAAGTNEVTHFGQWTSGSMALREAGAAFNAKVGINDNMRYCRTGYNYFRNADGIYYFGADCLASRVGFAFGATSGSPDFEFEQLSVPTDYGTCVAQLNNVGLAAVDTYSESLVELDTVVSAFEENIAYCTDDAKRQVGFDEVRDLIFAVKGSEHETAYAGLLDTDYAQGFSWPAYMWNDLRANSEEAAKIYADFSKDNLLSNYLTNCYQSPSYVQDSKHPKWRAWGTECFLGRLNLLFTGSLETPITATSEAKLIDLGTRAKCLSEQWYGDSFKSDLVRYEELLPGLSTLGEIKTLAH